MTLVSFSSLDAGAYYSSDLEDESIMGTEWESVECWILHMNEGIDIPQARAFNDNGLNRIG